MNKNLALSYLNTLDSPMRIQQRQDGKMLLLWDDLAENNHYQSQGWQADSLGAKEIPAEKAKYDIVISHFFTSYRSDWKDVLKKLHSHLHEGAQVSLRFHNGLYYQNLIDRSTRELKPWPGHRPKGQLFDIAVLQSELEDLGFQIVHSHEEMDDLFHNPQSSRWQTVNGQDCKVHLPTDSLERRKSFIRWQDITMVSNHQQEASVVREKMEKSRLDQVESLLQNAHVDEAEKMMQEVSLDEQNSWRYSCNLGLIKYYRGEFLESFLKFLEALERNPENEDLYFNLMDSAQKINKVEEVKNLVRVAMQKYPELKSIHELI